MRVELHSTTRTVQIEGITARVWEGRTAEGIPCYAIIPRIACTFFVDAREFDQDVQKHEPPSPDAVALVPNIFAANTGAKYSESAPPPRVKPGRFGK